MARVKGLWSCLLAKGAVLATEQPGQFKAKRFDPRVAAFKEAPFAKKVVAFRRKG